MLCPWYALLFRTDDCDIFHLITIFVMWQLNESWKHYWTCVCECFWAIPRKLSVLPQNCPKSSCQLVWFNWCTHLYRRSGNIEVTQWHFFCPLYLNWPSGFFSHIATVVQCTYMKLTFCWNVNDLMNYIVQNLYINLGWHISWSMLKTSSWFFFFRIHHPWTVSCMFGQALTQWRAFSLAVARSSRLHSFSRSGHLSRCCMVCSEVPHSQAVSAVSA